MDDRFRPGGESHLRGFPIRLTSRSSERLLSRAVLHHRLSAGVAQLYVGLN